MLQAIDSKYDGSPCASESLILHLEVSDPAVIDYLRGFRPEEVDARAAEALRVGVIALRSVTPTLDAGVVEQKFKDLERNLDAYAREFRAELQTKIDHYFKSDTGSVPRHLDGLIGEGGALQATLEEYFGVQRGRLSQVVQEQIGPRSEFGRLIDPDNSSGLLGRMQSLVERKLQESSNGVLAQFSLDVDDSALSKLRREMQHQVTQIREENATFFSELKAHFGIQRAREEEALRGTQKGRDFEALVYERVAELGRSLGDLTESLTGTPGNIAGCKTGDYVSVLGGDSGAAGKRFVLEAKNKQGKSLCDALEELARAKKNRDACVGVMIFASDCCPAEVGNFRIVDQDVVVSVDKEHLAAGEQCLYLESAYRIARAMVVAQRKQQLISSLDAGRITTALHAIDVACERFAELHKKATGIKQGAAAIEEIADQMRPEIEHRLREIELLAQAVPTV